MTSSPPAGERCIRSAMSDHVGLGNWLTEHVGLSTPVSFVRVGAGQSNVTYRATDVGDNSCIVRRPPPGNHDAGAHDVLREARVLRALAETGIRVPTVLGTHDPTPSGQLEFPFYVMSAMPGQVIETPSDAADLSGAERLDLSSAMVAALAQIHLVDLEATGLQDLGRRGDFVARQLRRGVRNWDQWGRGSQVDRAWQDILTRLQATPPSREHSVLNHGDFRLSNVLVQKAEVTAVLDWELCTIGDPLADLAWMLDDWRTADEPSIAIPSPTQAGGFADRDQLVREYSDLTSIDVSDVDYYRAFTHWKAATLLQGVLIRRRSGVLGDHGSLDLDELQRTVEFLIAEAGDLLQPTARTRRQSDVSIVPHQLGTAETL
jgi:aminoglycoside phosphotransferase (APT) family kinase protein